MVFVTSASRYITSASRYITSASRHDPRYQSRSSMYIRGLIPRNFAELAEAVPIGCAPKQDSDQPRRQFSLIRIFAVHTLKSLIHSLPLGAKQMPRLI